MDSVALLMSSLTVACEVGVLTRIGMSPIDSPCPALWETLWVSPAMTSWNLSLGCACSLAELKCGEIALLLFKLKESSILPPTKRVMCLSSVLAVQSDLLAGVCIGISVSSSGLSTQLWPRATATRRALLRETDF